jgi:hypothetical protein
VYIVSTPPTQTNRDAQQQEVLAATAAYVVSDMKFDVLLQLVDLLR